MRNYTTSRVQVFPGINPKALVRNLPAQQRSIVNVLAKEFYITGGFNTLMMGTSEYRYFFLKFPHDKAIAFGARDEIIVLMSDFEKFEPRTLDAIEKIQELNPGFRLDKICAFVISKDSDFLEKLDRTIKTQKESRLITPFTYQELVGDQPNEFYRNRIRRYFFERNLFDFDSPLRRDIYFFGRDDICQSLIDKHITGQNSSLFGLRRSGKTSILLSVCRRLAHQGGIGTLIDCQTLYQTRWNTALLYIVNRINDEHHAKLTFDENLYTEGNAAIEFAKDIERLRKKLKNTILLAFDEVEQITFNISFSTDWRDGHSYVRFWHSVRSVTQLQDNPLTVLIAGTNPRCLEVPFVMGGDNPLYGQIKPEFIKPFTVTQTKQMVETLSSYMGITLDDDIYTYLARDFGGHPFLIRQACSFIKSVLDAGEYRHVDRLLYDSAIRDFSNGPGHAFCEMVIGVLSEHFPDEYTMLTYLARSDVEDFTQLADSDPHYTLHLVGYGVIAKSPAGYDFKIDAVKRYLSQKERYKKLNLTNEEKLAEISARRNEVEHKLRKMVSQVLRTRFGEPAAKQKIVLRHPPAARSRAEALAYRDLFNPSKANIYFNDLTELMRKDWDDAFKNIFSEDVEKFTSRMILLNSVGRSDAHSKVVTDADMQTFRGAMSWLEGKISDYFA